MLTTRAAIYALVYIWQTRTRRSLPHMVTVTKTGNGHISFLYRCRSCGRRPAGILGYSCTQVHWLNVHSDENNRRYYDHSCLTISISIPGEWKTHTHTHTHHTPTLEMDGKLISSSDHVWYCSQRNPTESSFLRYQPQIWNITCYTYDFDFS